MGGRKLERRQRRGRWAGEGEVPVQSFGRRSHGAIGRAQSSELSRGIHCHDTDERGAIICDAGDSPGRAGRRSLQDIITSDPYGDLHAGSMRLQVRGPTACGHASCWRCESGLGMGTISPPSTTCGRPGRSKARRSEASNAADACKCGHGERRPRDAIQGSSSATTTTSVGEVRLRE